MPTVPTPCDTVVNPPRVLTALADPFDRLNPNRALGARSAKVAAILASTLPEDGNR